ncbi:hypothetical protein BC832DRAFT_278055 [Gaertneriomyces semiglobifer]|nr:hypothetical protein BC832DRAFT_278055 [Gaertneriomyces semiglobifer]
MLVEKLTAILASTLTVVGVSAGSVASPLPITRLVAKQVSGEQQCQQATLAYLEKVSACGAAASQSEAVKCICPAVPEMESVLRQCLDFYRVGAGYSEVQIQAVQAYIDQMEATCKQAQSPDTGSPVIPANPTNPTNPVNPANPAIPTNPAKPANPPTAGPNDSSAPDATGKTQGDKGVAPGSGAAASTVQWALGGVAIAATLLGTL